MEMVLARGVAYMSLLLGGRPCYALGQYGMSGMVWVRWYG